MEKIENTSVITIFEDKGKNYVSILTKDKENKYKKSIYDEDFKEIIPTKELFEIEKEKGVILLDKDKKDFIKQYNSLVKELEKELKKNEKELKNDLKESEYENYTNENMKVLFEKNNIKEGNIYSITVSDNDKKENSVAFFKVVKSKKNDSLYLTPYIIDPNFKSDENIHSISNASFLAGSSAISLISSEHAEKKLMKEYRKNNPDDNINYVENRLTVSATDITELALKSIKNIKKESFENSKLKKENNNETNLNKIEIINKIPSQIQKIFSEKNKEINEKIYTEKMFNMFKTLSNIPNEDRNINNLEKKIFGPLLNKLEKNKNNINEQRKIFSQWVFDNKNSTDMENAGNLFEKTLSDNFKGYKIKRDNYDVKERDENVEAILNNTLPIMKDKKNVDYIYDPDTSSVYQGNTQMALQRNNNEAGYQTDTYVSADSMIKNEPDTIKKGMKVKYEVAELGKDKEGRKHYAILVPIKPSWSEKRDARRKEKEEKKKEKDRRNEEYKRNVADAKYLKKYGELPEYKTALQPLPANQPALVSSTEIINPYPKPTKESSIEEKFSYECANYFKSMFTKEPFVRGTDWLEKENKKELLNFAKTKPELFRSLYDAAYNQITAQIKQINRNNSDINQIVKAVTDVQEKENVNENTKKRVR